MRVDFEKMDWAEVANGAKQKVATLGDQQMRILKLEDGFVEPDWCTKAHTGYVLNGRFSIDFDGTIQHFEKGQGLSIPSGASHRHKAVIEKGGLVELVLFETRSNEEPATGALDH